MPINGATMLLQELLSADRITIFFGTQVNEAYEQIKPGIRLRSTVIETLTAQLGRFPGQTPGQSYRHRLFYVLWSSKIPPP